LLFMVIVLRFCPVIRLSKRPASALALPVIIFKHVFKTNQLQSGTLST
jgi:hypothetical protein